MGIHVAITMLHDDGLGERSSWAGLESLKQVQWIIIGMDPVEYNETDVVQLSRRKMRNPRAAGAC